MDLPLPVLLSGLPCCLDGIIVRIYVLDKLVSGIVTGFNRFVPLVRAGIPVGYPPCLCVIQRVLRAYLILHDYSLGLILMLPNTWLKQPNFTAFSISPFGITIEGS